ncbi:DUF7575 domain-containing protein [Halomontanus rarus]|uniref:DUF7575 domain-containing protein n=1 Tax=Halomontanus rarus TaxID=3034020 RepID=UPI003CE4781F
MSLIRALFAAALSLVLPGAGHALIRDWVRALLFAGLFLSATALIMPINDIAAAGSMAERMTIVTDEPRTSQFVLSFMLLFTAVDAGFRALGFPPGSNGADGPTCPNCGRELDPEIEFCHWCTTRLEYADPDVESESEAESTADADADIEIDTDADVDVTDESKSNTESTPDSNAESESEPEPKTK